MGFSIMECEYIENVKIGGEAVKIDSSWWDSKGSRSGRFG